MVDVTDCARQMLEVPSTGLLEALASDSSVACAALTPFERGNPLPSMDSAGRGQSGATVMMAAALPATGGHSGRGVRSDKHQGTHHAVGAGLVSCGKV